MKDDAATDVDDAFDESQDFHVEADQTSAEDLVQTKARIRARRDDQPSDMDDAFDESQDYHSEEDQNSAEDLV